MPNGNIHGRIRPVRPLDAAERQALDFLLATDVDGREEGVIRVLRASADRARVAEQWECCPSFTFAPFEDGRCEGAPLIGARHRSEPFELLLFASTEGELRCLEIVHYAEATIREFPNLDDFEPPTLLEA